MGAIVIYILFWCILNYRASQLYVSSMPHLDVPEVPVHPWKQVLPKEEAAALGYAVPAGLHVSACAVCVHSPRAAFPHSLLP